jgi:hypothetical protein
MNATVILCAGGYGNESALDESLLDGGVSDNGELCEPPNVNSHARSLSVITFDDS